MRTTLRIDDDLIVRLKQRALREGISLGACVNQILRQEMNGVKQAPPRERFVQETFDMGVPLIDLSKANEFLAELDVEEFLRNDELLRKMESRQ